jgi:hypothetical protein
MLRTPQFSVRSIIRKMNVKLICTTEGPLDSLEHHRKIKEEGFEIKVHAALRPDKGLAVQNLPALNAWIDKLEGICDTEIRNFSSYIAALRARHHFFHANGCRLSDYGLETAYAEDYNEREIKNIFNKIRSGKQLDQTEQLKFKSAMMFEFALMDYECGWVMQLHDGNNDWQFSGRLCGRQDAMGLGVVVPRPKGRDGRADANTFEYGAVEPICRHAYRLAQLSVLPAARVFPATSLQHAGRRRRSRTHTA